MADRYLTAAEVADLVRTPVETVRYWRRSGLGPRSFKLGRRVLYAEDDVNEWLEHARENDLTRRGSVA